MISITKDEVFGTRYNEVPKWRSKKTKLEIFAEAIMNHKILTVVALCFAICMVTNIILIYSFVKILGEM